MGRIGIIARLCLGAVIALATAGVHAATADDEVLAARDAYRTGDVTRLARYAERLRGHVLEPYVVYWKLSAKLEQANPAEVRAFIDANGDSPLSDRLRSEWLKRLGKNQQWDLFDADFPRLRRIDVEITCYSLQSRLRESETRALTDARALWFLGRPMPDSCGPLFDALIANRHLSTDDIWMRLRLALEAGQVSLARRIAEYLPAGQAPNGGTLSAIASNPGRYLERRHFNYQSRAGRETTLFAVHRLARISPPQAAAQWARLEERFDADARAYVWGLIAYFGAMRHDQNALAWYERAADLSDLQLAWKVRAALRARDWKAVLDAIETMTGKESIEASWRYWRARALRELDRSEEADALLKPLAGEFSFYGQLAVEDLGGKIAAPATAFRPSSEDLSAIGALPGIRRALALFRLGLRLEATREWLWAIREFDDRQLLTAAEVARRYEIHDRAIGTADRTVSVHDFNLRYLAPYRDVLGSHARKLDLDEAWVYGLIRQESRFIADARSGAGASGLMQLMPATAQWVARKLGLKNWRLSRVTDVDLNVRLGTYYLRHVLDVLDGSPVLASAAYNAGPGRARLWRPAGAVEGAVYAESIPFSETRDYVKKVMSNATYYAWTFSEETQSLRQRLGSIGARNLTEEISLLETP